MPKLSCLCGNSVNLSPVPNENGYRVFWQPRIDTLIERLLVVYQERKTKEEFEKVLYGAIYRTKPEPLQVYEWKSCGRLAIFTNPSHVQPALWYKLEKCAEQKATTLQSLVSRR